MDTSLSPCGSALPDILAAGDFLFPSVTGCLPRLQTVLLFPLVSWLFLWWLNTVSFPAICFSQLLSFPLAAPDRFSLCFPLAICSEPVDSRRHRPWPGSNKLPGPVGPRLQAAVLDCPAPHSLNHVPPRPRRFSQEHLEVLPLHVQFANRSFGCPT